MSADLVQASQGDDEFLLIDSTTPWWKLGARTIAILDRPRASHAHPQLEPQGGMIRVPSTELGIAPRWVNDGVAHEVSD